MDGARGAGLKNDADLLRDARSRDQNGGGAPPDAAPPQRFVSMGDLQNQRAPGRTVLLKSTRRAWRGVAGSLCRCRRQLCEQRCSSRHCASGRQCQGSVHGLIASVRAASVRRAHCCGCRRIQSLQSWRRACRVREPSAGGWVSACTKRETRGARAGANVPCKRRGRARIAVPSPCRTADSWRRRRQQQQPRPARESGIQPDHGATRPG